MVLANGQRAGFFIGDGAGVGKGRQVSMHTFFHGQSMGDLLNDRQDIFFIFEGEKLAIQVFLLSLWPIRQHYIQR